LKKKNWKANTKRYSEKLIL